MSMNTSTEPKIYKTTDLFLVSFLLDKGISPETECKGRLVVFAYPNYSGQEFFEELISKYQTEDLPARLPRVRLVYDDLRRRVKEFQQFGKPIF